MRVKWLPCLLLAAGLCTASLDVQAYEERNLLQQQAEQASLKDMLVMGQKWVNYPAYKDRDGWNQLFGTYRTSVIRNGEKQLSYGWEVVKATDYMEFERTGNRQIMERPFGRNAEAVVQLLLAELAEGKGRFLDQLANGVFHLCEMTSWALSAHLPSQPSHRSLPNSMYHLIDLTAGDLGGMLSWVYYFMHEEFDKLDPEISARLYRELDRRIMTPYLEDDSFWWMAVHYKGQMVNNWNPWCNFNALMCFMLIENDKDRLAKAVWRSMESVDKYLNYVHADGACEEGPAYWGHAPGKLLDYLELLGKITGGKVNLFRVAQVRNMGEYISRSYVGSGWVVNFADASAKGGGDSHLIYRYGKAVGSDELMHFASFLNQDKQMKWSGRDVYRILQAFSIDGDMRKLEPSHEVPAFTWYPETEFYYLSKGDAFLAAKGGYNSESHNHNDAGSCSFWYRQTPILIDAGVGTYTRQTFSNERYSIWTMQSDYHNLPLVNGYSQKDGRQYKARVLKATDKEFSADLAAAYPREAGIKEWKRSYRLSSGKLTVQDRFRLDNPKEKNQVNFLTWGDVKLDEGKVMITVNGVTAELVYNPQLFEAGKETVELTDPRLSSVWGKEVYRLVFKARKLEQNGSYAFTLKFD